MANDNILDSDVVALGPMIIIRPALLPYSCTTLHVSALR